MTSPLRPDALSLYLIIYGSGRLPGGAITILVNRPFDDVALESFGELQARKDPKLDLAGARDCERNEVTRSDAGRMTDISGKGELTVREHFADRHCGYLSSKESSFYVGSGVRSFPAGSSP